ncbi:hypothetical protein EYF80_028246 [Liparis tanakae]|uniref:Uncharacterized protein n=1 Tax=Liparis tanakae TaxID=230148 RepID=A0A4Z2H797_9TELE|nr:hypothetical protein EYF80_028246 [Liparis tanakae]
MFMAMTASRTATLAPAFSDEVCERTEFSESVRVLIRASPGGSSSSFSREVKSTPDRWSSAYFPLATITTIWSADFRYCSWWVTRIRSLFFRRPQMHLSVDEGQGSGVMASWEEPNPREACLATSDRVVNRKKDSILLLKPLPVSSPE